MAEGCAGCSLLGLFDLAVPACSTGSHPSGSQAVLQEDCLWGGTAVPGITALWEWKQGYLHNRQGLKGVLLLDLALLKHLYSLQR